MNEPDIHNMGDSEITDAGMKNSLLLSNLEKWIDAVILQDGLTDKQLIAKVKESFNRSMQANIDYHTFMSNNTDIESDQNRHKLLVKVYKELLR